MKATMHMHVEKSKSSSQASVHCPVLSDTQIAWKINGDMNALSCQGHWETDRGREGSQNIETHINVDFNWQECLFKKKLITLMDV